MEKDKPDLKIVDQNKPDNLTVKQRKFIEHIVKGKVKTQKEAYALASVSYTHLTLPTILLV